jgi:hypothetical protein
VLGLERSGPFAHALSFSAERGSGGGRALGAVNRSGCCTERGGASVLRSVPMPTSISTVSPAAQRGIAFADGLGDGARRPCRGDDVAGHNAAILRGALEHCPERVVHVPRVAIHPDDATPRTALHAAFRHSTAPSRHGDDPRAEHSRVLPWLAPDRRHFVELESRSSSH